MSKIFSKGENVTDDETVTDGKTVADGGTGTDCENVADVKAVAAFETAVSGCEIVSDGEFFSEGENVTDLESTVSGCETVTDGNILTDDGETVPQATSCNFTGNQSPYDGGAIISTGGMSNMTFTDCRFEENIAGYSGGAMRVDSASVLTVRNSVFLNNTAVSDRYNGGGQGGAIYVWEGTPRVEFHSCDFRLNTAADGGGGGVELEAAGSLLVDGSTFKDNWAKYSGGGITATGEVEQV